MLIRGSVQLSWRRCVLVPAVLVSVALAVMTSAAPVSEKVKVTSEEAVVKGESEKPLVRAKRADEIIFDNVQNVAASSSSPVKKSDQQVDAKTDDVTKAVEKQQETAQSTSEADESDVGNGDNAPADDSSENSSDDSGSEGADSVTWDSDTDDVDKRRRRSASGSVAAGVAAADRTKREAGAAMVAENMAVGATGNSRLQRAKRDLDADDIREIFEAGQPLTESAGDGQGLDYGQPEYGSPARDYADTVVSPSDEGEDGEEPEEEEEEEGDYEDAAEDNVEDEFDDEQLRYVGRPKRRSTLTDDEREEALESAERQVIRELLAERAAEETRQALINYLTGYDQPVMSEPSHGIVERYDERFRDEGFDDEGYSEDEDDNGEEDGEENGYEEDEEAARESDGPADEGLVENGDGGFLAEEPGADGSELDEQAPSMVEQKRFSYPYSYEPYGGRWGALVPGAKRDDHDPYDRLYRLAEALSRPSSIGGDGATDDEYKK